MPSIDELRKKFPNAASQRTDAELAQWYGEKSGVAPDKALSYFGIAPRENKGLVGDTYTMFKAGIQDLPSATAGLLDIPVAAATGETKFSDAMGNIARGSGFNPHVWAQETRKDYSKATQAAQAEVAKAKADDSVLGTVGAYITNPRAAYVGVGESIPSMLAGGGVGAGIRKLGANAYLAAGAGEGAVMAGQNMDSMVRSGVDPRKAALLSAGVGVAGGVIGVAGGKLASKLGLEDVDLLVSGGAPVATRAATSISLPKRMAAGFVQEGVLEEAPQSAVETMAGNYGRGDPITKGLGVSMAEGAMLGGVMGAGFNIRNANAKVASDLESKRQVDMLAKQKEGTEAGITAPNPERVMANARQEAEDIKAARQIIAERQAQAVAELPNTINDMVGVRAKSKNGKDDPIAKARKDAMAAYNEKLPNPVILPDENGKPFSTTDAYHLYMYDKGIPIPANGKQGKTANTVQTQVDPAQQTVVAPVWDFKAPDGTVLPTPVEAGFKGKKRAEVYTTVAKAMHDGVLEQEDFDGLVNDVAQMSNQTKMVERVGQSLDDAYARASANTPELLRDALNAERIKFMTPKQAEWVNARRSYETEGMSDAQVAKMVGITPSQAADFSTRFTTTAIAKLAKRYKITPDQVKELLAPVKQQAVADDGTAGLAPKDQASVLDERELFGTEGVPTGMSTIKSVGGSQSNIGETVANPDADKVDPIQVQRAKEAAQARDNLMEMALQSDLAEIAIEDWDDMKSARAPAAKDLPREAAGEWIITYGLWKNGTYTEDDLIAEQREIERGLLTAIERPTLSDAKPAISGSESSGQAEPSELVGENVQDAGTGGEELQALIASQEQDKRLAARQAKEAEEDVEPEDGDADNASVAKEPPQAKAISYETMIKDLRAIEKNNKAKRSQAADYIKGIINGTAKPAEVTQWLDAIKSDVKLSVDTSSTAKLTDADQVKNRLRGYFSNQAAFDRVVTVVQSASELPQRVLGSVGPNSSAIQGFATGSGKIYLVAGNIRPGRELAVLLHELGHVGMEKLIGQEKMTRLALQIKRWSTQDGTREATIAKRAMARVRSAERGNALDKTNTSDIIEERVAYFIEEAVKDGINPLALNDIKEAGLREWFRRVKVLVESIMRRFGVDIRKLTAQDVVDLAYGAANLALDTSTVQPRATITNTLKSINDTVGREKVLVGLYRLAESAYDESTSPEDAYDQLYEAASAKQRAILRALAKDDLLGFSYPHDAIYELIENSDSYELSPSTKGAISKAGNKALFSVDASSIAPAANAVVRDAMIDTGAAMSTLGPSLLTNFQLHEQYGALMPSLEKHMTLTDKMAVRQRELSQKSIEALNPWSDYNRKNAESGKRLANVMMRATMLGMHPDEAFDSEGNKHLTQENRADHDKLVSEYNALGKEGQAIYQNVKRILKDTWRLRKEIYAEMVTAAYDNELNAAKAAGDQKAVDKIEAKKTKAIDEHAKTIRDIKGPYFPLMRFGDYILIAKSQELNDKELLLNNSTNSDATKAIRAEVERMRKDPAHYQVHSFEKASQRQAKATELAGMNIRMTKGEAYMRELRPVANGAIEELTDKLSGDLSSTEGAKLRRAMTDLLLASLPENAALKRQIKRNNVEGASSDMLRAFAEAIERDSFYLSRMEYAGQISANMYNMKTESRDDDQLRNVYNNMRKRVGMDMAYTPAPWAQRLSALSSFFHLGVAPSYILTNMMQPFTITVPQLAGKFGMAKTFGEIRKAWGDAANTIKVSKAEGGAFAQVDFSKTLKGGELEMAKALQDLGKLDIAQNIDTEIFTSGTDPRITKAQQAFSWASHHVELVNRLSTALAAYRLETKNGVPHDKAVERAREAVELTQLTYDDTNAAYFMKAGHFGGWNRIPMQFRKYSQGMLYLLYRDGKKAFAGDKDALASLGYLMSMTVAMAGTSGLPIAFPIALLAAMFGPGDDDEDGDATTQMRNYLSDTIGPDAARVFWKGLPAMMGVDSANLGMGDLLNPLPMMRGSDITDANTGQDATKALMFNMAGAGVGTIANFADAAILMNKGELGKGVEKMLPKFVASPLKAARISSDGITTRSGNTAVDAEQIDAWDTTIKALGFSPIVESEHYTAQNAKENVASAISDDRKALLRRYAQASGDPEKLADIREAINEFNIKHAGYKITYKNLSQSVKSSKQRDGEMDEAGVRYGKRDESLKGISRFAY